jgi:hypothetical protein
MADTFSGEGSCLCGAVRIQVGTEHTKVGACHCNMCRKWCGSPLMVLNVGADYRFEGEEHIKVFKSSDWAERGFCSLCGSHLFYRLIQSGAAYVCPGLFADQNHFSFTEQVFIDEKPGFYDFANETHNMTGPEVIALFADSSE